MYLEPQPQFISKAEESLLSALALMWSSVSLWLLSVLSLRIVENSLSETRAALQLVLETPETIALPLSMNLLGTGKVPLVPRGPVCFESLLTQVMVII